MAATNTIEKTRWAIDPSHSEVSFKVRHLMITNVKGVFKEFLADIYTTGGDFVTSDLDFSLVTESVDTGDDKRDGHLRSGDFFDSSNYREIKFRGQSVLSKSENGNYVLLGDLTIREVTKPVKLDVEFNGLMKDPWGNEKAGYSVSGTINRKDWGLNWNAALEAGGVLVSDDVKILCEVQLIRQN